jgi:8-oxo-dGTP pyrophosphatase MutT (NUDIX family)
MAAPSGSPAPHAAVASLHSTLARYRHAELEEQGLADAAVLLLLYEREGQLSTVFQRRTETVLHHKGQVSLPGGAVDPEDQSLQHAALREAFEEIGADPARVQPLGRLDDIRTISGFRVAPFVGWYQDPAARWTHNHREVAYLMEVPVATLANPAIYVPETRVIDGLASQFPAYQVGPDLIWGATARIVQNFLDVVLTAGLSLEAPGPALHG